MAVSSRPTSMAQDGSLSAPIKREREPSTPSALEDSQTEAAGLFSAPQLTIQFRSKPRIEIVANAGHQLVAVTLLHPVVHCDDSSASADDAIQSLSYVGLSRAISRFRSIAKLTQPR